MKRYITLLVICVVAAFMAPQVQAQCPTANPLDVINNTNWGFHIEGASILSTAPPPVFVYAVAGVFSAIEKPDKNGNPTGVLTVISTTSENVGIYRLQPSGGRYQIFADCSGGVLMFTLGTVNLEYDFWFVSGQTEMYLIGDDSGTIAVGVARRT